MFDNKKTKSVIEGATIFAITIGGATLISLLLFTMAVVNAFVLSTIWGWYIVPFFNQPPLPLAVAFGINLIFATLKGWKPPKENEPKTDAKQTVALMVIFPLMVLLTGWIGTFFL